MYKLSTLLAVVLVFSTSLFIDSASAAPVTDNVVQGAYFTNPHKADRRRDIIDMLNSTINQTKKGATIRIATYAFDLKSSTDRLIAAKKRGVNVQIIVDWQNVNQNYLDPYLELRKSFGTDTKKLSFIAHCGTKKSPHSCRSDRPGSIMHSKYMLVSNSDGKPWITITGSANMAKNGRNSFNNMYRAIGDHKLYAAFRSDFNAMLAKDIDGSPDPYRAISSNPYRVWFYPQPVRSDRENDTILSELDRVKCNGVSKGYGYKGKTDIRIAMMHWSNARTAAAKKVRDLSVAGCHVEVVYNSGGTSKDILDIFQQAPKLLLLNAKTTDKIYMHNKYLLVNGNFAGHGNQKLTWTMNFNMEYGVRSANEVMLRIDSARIWLQYGRNFQEMKQYSKPRSAADTLSVAGENGDN